ncbi:MAG TPA: methyltransferase type 12, partial [Ramlibacter sp.]
MNPFGTSPRRPSSATSAGESFAFLRGFLRNPAQVGSVIPSSPQLEQRLLQCAKVADARTVVELGPGTGGTTRALLGAMPSAAVL